MKNFLNFKFLSSKNVTWIHLCHIRVDNMQYFSASREISSNSIWGESDRNNHFGYPSTDKLVILEEIGRG
jgi:hypothetical protein